MKIAAVAHAGRAPACQAGGRGIVTPRPLRADPRAPTSGLSAPQGDVGYLAVTSKIGVA